MYCDRYTKLAVGNFVEIPSVINLYNNLLHQLWKVIVYPSKTINKIIYSKSFTFSTTHLVSGISSYISRTVTPSTIFLNTELECLSHKVCIRFVFTVEFLRY